MASWKRMLGLDQVAAAGDLAVDVRYLDGTSKDGTASGTGFLNVSPRGLVWKIDGYNLGNRDWPDVAGWTQHDAVDRTSRLVVVFEGQLRVRQSTSQMRITVTLTSTTKEVRRLTTEAQRHAKPGVVVIDA